jgi:hypothetical protein
MTEMGGDHPGTGASPAAQKILMQATLSFKVEDFPEELGYNARTSGETLQSASVP